MINLDDDRMDLIAIHGDFGRDILLHEVVEVIEEAISEGVLSKEVIHFASGSEIVLGLRLSDEVRVISEPVGLRDFISTDTADTRRDAVRFVLTRAVEVLEETRAAALGGRQADWRHVKVFGD